MKYIETKPMDDKTGQTIFLREDHIMYVWRQPLESFFMVAANNLALRMIGNLEDYVGQIEGLVKLLVPEGTTAYVNPKFVTFYAPTEQLGVYLLLFPGGLKLVIKETGEQLARILSGEPSIVI